MVNSVDYCGLLNPETLDNPLSDCLSHLGPEVVHAYYEGCKIDVSILRNDGNNKEAKDMACVALLVVVTLCREQNVNINPVWRNATGCGE